VHSTQPWRSQRTHGSGIVRGVCPTAASQPLKAAEEISVLDLLSNGRAGLGMGEGASITELHPFNVRVRDKREIFEDAVRCLVPMFGDADDGYIVRLDQDPAYSPYRSALGIGALLFRRGDFKLKAGRLDDKARWLLGPDAQARYNALDADATRLPLRQTFPEGRVFAVFQPHLFSRTRALAVEFGRALASGGKVKLDDASDIGFLRVDREHGELLFEGDNEYYRIRGEAIVSCDIELFISGEGSHGATKLYRVVLQVNDASGLREIPIAQRGNVGKYRAKKRAEWAQELQQEIQGLMGASAPMPSVR